MATELSFQDPTTKTAKNPITLGMPSAVGSGLIRPDELHHRESFNIDSNKALQTVMGSISALVGLDTGLLGSVGLDIFNLQVDTSKTGKNTRPVTFTTDLQERQPAKSLDKLEAGDAVRDVQYVTTITLHIRNLLDASGRLVDVEATECAIIMSVCESVLRARQPEFLTKDGREDVIISRGVLVNDSGKWLAKTVGLAAWFAIDVLEDKSSQS